MANENMWSDILSAIWSIFQTKIQTKDDPAPTPAPLPDVSIHINSTTYKLHRIEFKDEGIFGELRDPQGNLIAHTLEHSYNDAPKVPNGLYQCNRSAHRLHGMTEDFITFQVMNVPGHDNILFHWGNYNKDSEGCILLGQQEVGTMITNSRATWAKFMAGLEGQDSFALEVS